MNFDNLLSHYHHQDNLMWRSVVWAIPVEFGTLLSSVNAEEVELKLPFLIFGTVLIFALGMYAIKACRDLNQVTKELEKLDSDFPIGIKDRCWCLRGRFWLVVIFLTMFVANILLGVLVF